MLPGGEVDSAADARALAERDRLPAAGQGGGRGRGPGHQARPGRGRARRPAQPGAQRGGRRVRRRPRVPGAADRSRPPRRGADRRRRARRGASTSASATARCSAATRRWSRRRPRRQLDRRHAPTPAARPPSRFAERDRLPQPRHRRVRDRRRHRRALLPGDQLPDPGRAPGHRGDHRPRPGRRCSCRSPPASRSVRPGRRLLPRPRRSNAGSTPRTRATAIAPAPGTLSLFAVPERDGLRVDTHCQAGAAVPPYYDSLLAKLIGHGADREHAIDILIEALEDLDVDGVETNRTLLIGVLGHPRLPAPARSPPTGWSARSMTASGRSSSSTRPRATATRACGAPPG